MNAYQNLKSCKPNGKTKQQNTKSSGEKLKTRGQMFFASFFLCDLQILMFEPQSIQQKLFCTELTLDELVSKANVIKS